MKPATKKLTSEQVGKEILEILKKSNCQIAINLIPKNLFTKIFQKFIKFNFDIRVQKVWRSLEQEKKKS